MNAGTLQGIGTILAMVAFAGVVWWAYGSKRKARFEEAAMLPFVEDDLTPPPHASPVEPASRSSTHE